MSETTCMHLRWCLSLGCVKMFYADLNGLSTLLTCSVWFDLQRNLFFVCLASASSGHGEFGDWSTFSDMQPALSPVNPVTTDLFAPGPASTLPSADLFDLMGPSVSTNISASQSVNFCMTSTQSPGLPLSKSQVCLTSIYCVIVMSWTNLFFHVFFTMCWQWIYQLPTPNFLLTQWM